jgi:hypothetical protein
MDHAGRTRDKDVLLGDLYSARRDPMGYLRHRGGLLFGNFLLAEQEKVTQGTGGGAPRVI